MVDVCQTEDLVQPNLRRAHESTLTPDAKRAAVMIVTLSVHPYQSASHSAVSCACVSGMSCAHIRVKLTRSDRPQNWPRKQLALQAKNLSTWPGAVAQLVQTMACRESHPCLRIVCPIPSPSSPADSRPHQTPSTRTSQLSPQLWYRFTQWHCAILTSCSFTPMRFSMRWQYSGDSSSVMCADRLMANMANPQRLQSVTSSSGAEFELILFRIA